MVNCMNLLAMLTLLFDKVVYIHSSYRFMGTDIFSGVFFA